MGFEKMLNEKRERERGREGSEVVLCRGWARGARRRRRRRRGSWSRSNEPREKLSGAGRGAGRGAAVALSNKLDCLHEKAERLVRGPVVVETLSLSLGPIALFLLFVPAGYIPLLFFARRGLTVCTRDAATPQECPTSPPRAYLYNLLYLGPTVASSILSS